MCLDEANSAQPGGCRRGRDGLPQRRLPERIFLGHFFGIVGKACRMLFDEIVVDQVFRDDDMGHGVEEEHVRAALDRQINGGDAPVSVRRGSTQMILQPFFLARTIWRATRGCETGAL